MASGILRAILHMKPNPRHIFNEPEKLTEKCEIYIEELSTCLMEAVAAIN